MQHRKGFLWFGTINGLNRFDGFRIYRHDHDDSTNSRPTFYRKIKALSNLTPHELIHITRLKKAAELLADGNYKVYEVAAMVGYSLQTNFARDFHKQFGMTPSEYVSDTSGKKIPINKMY